jgi:Domain of unknown function (DUF4345)
MLSLFLRLFAIGCALVSLLHITFGLGADNMLGAGLSREILSNPTLDSQNRFYGATFMLFGWTAWLCASDPKRYRTLLQGAMAILFLSGVARLVSILLYGLPSSPVIMLAVIELVLPPIVVMWARRELVD